MASWDYMKESDPYLEFLREQARKAMNDKEVGLIGQAEAAKDYEDLNKRLNDNRVGGSD